MPDELPVKENNLPWLKSLAGKLSLAMVRLLVVILLIMGLGLAGIAMQAEEKSAYQLQQQRANQVSVVISSYLVEAIDSLELFLSLESIENMNAAQKKSALERLLMERRLLVSQLILLDSEGYEQIKVSRNHTYLPDELGFAGDTDYYREAMAGRTYISPIYLSDDNGLLSVLAVVPAIKENGSPDGALCAEVNLSLLWQELAGIQNGETGYAYIVDNKGRFVAYQDLSTVLQRYGEEMNNIPAVAAFMHADGKDNGQIGKYTGLTGQEVIGAYAPISETNWAAVVEMPEQEAYAGINQMRFYSGFLILAGIIASIWIASVMSRSFVQPILVLADTARRLGDGELDAIAAGSERPDELGVLAGAFNKMRERLVELIHTLEKNVNELGRSRQEQAELIVEQEKRNTELVNLRELLKNIIDSMPSILIGVDQNGLVTQWNAEASKLTGLSAEQAVGRILRDVMPALGNQMALIEKAIEENMVHREDRVLLLNNGETSFSELMVYPLTADHLEGAVVRVDDITEKVRLEEMMIQTEKMMSVGGLAAGMAHEINNPLGGIIQGAQNLERRLDPLNKKNQNIADECGIDLDRLHDYLEKRMLIEILDGIRQSGIRASKIVENMLRFSRSSETSHKLCDLNQLLDRSIELASSDYDLKKKYDFRYINIVRKYDPELLPVVCADMEIEQVILNIVKNSAQALGGMAEPEQHPSIILRSCMEDGMAVIEIEDNGPGMDDAVKRRIFEPFFTTKALGEGTGLGLSVSYFIITNNHNGQIYVESSPGHGTRFIIKLPL